MNTNNLTDEKKANKKLYRELHYLPKSLIIFDVKVIFFFKFCKKFSWIIKKPIDSETDLD